VRKEMDGERKVYSVLLKSKFATQTQAYIYIIMQNETARKFINNLHL